ncbi:MAG: peptidylprolyl isomerase [Eubacteriales bacterium]|nr:peptidylprolyl isomerase [Eubacteriales bacterium]
MSEVLKTIGEYTITERDVDAFISSLPKEQQRYRTMPDFRAQVLERVEEMTLFAMLGSEMKVEDTEDFKDAMMVAKRDISGQIAVHELLSKVDATEDEVKAFFEENKNAFAKGPSATAKHILVDSKEKAESIKKEIEAGEKTFEEAAKEYSSCPSSQKGGSLGTFGRGQMVKEFEQAAFEGELETIIGPVETQFGQHLIWVDERSEGEVPEFEAVKDQVKAQVIGQKQQKTYEEKLSALRDKYLA